MTESRGTRRTKRWLIGAAACLVGIPLSIVLHDPFDALSGMTSDFAILSSFLGFLGGACFWAALVLCPAGTAICLVAALLDRLTTRWRPVHRLILLILLPTVATVAVVTMFILNPSVLSYIELDDQAGFNGSFEVVKSGLPANWASPGAPSTTATLRFPTTPTIPSTARSHSSCWSIGPIPSAVGAARDCFR